MRTKKDILNKEQLAALGRMYKEQMDITSQKHSNRGKIIKEKLKLKTNEVKGGLAGVTPDSLDAVENIFNEIVLRSLGRRGDIDFILNILCGKSLEEIMEEANQDKKRRVDLILKYSKNDPAPDVELGKIIVKNISKKDFDVKKQLIVLFGGGTFMLSYIIKEVTLP